MFIEKLQGGVDLNRLCTSDSGNLRDVSWAGPNNPTTLPSWRGGTLLPPIR